MRIHAIACAAITIVLVTGCAGELAERPAAADPTNAASEEAPFREPPKYAEDPLLRTTPPPARSEPPAHEHHHHPTEPGK
jgi:hypothetical protein